MKQVRIVIIVSLLLGWTSVSACTLGSEVYEESGPYSAEVIFAAVRILTGKEWDQLETTQKEELITAMVSKGVTHVATDSGEVERIDTLLKDSALTPGRYRITSTGEGGGFIKVIIGRKKYWIEEWYGCYSTYFYDILVWNGYSGKLCSDDNFDPTLGTC